MPVEKNILIKPVNLEEVYDYMGVTSSNGIYDDVAICTYGGINKWAKCKPIRYPKKEVLTSEERAGSTQDKMNGIFYGVKLSGVAGNIEDMHSVTFDYYPVRGGVDWSRLTDFDGYDKNARPNPVGALPEVIYVDLTNPRGDCYIDYSTSNTTGVNIGDAIASMATTSSIDLGDCYPCVLVTIDGMKYVRALWNSHYELNATNDGYTTLRDNGAWWQNWAMLLSGLPDATEGKTLTVTIFFMRSIASAGMPDYRSWVNVDGTLSANNGYACPDAVAKTILLKRYYTRGLGVIGGSWTRNGNKIDLFLGLEWIEPTAGATYTLTGELYDGNTKLGGFSRTYTAGEQFDLLYTISASLLSTPTLRLEWSVTSSLNSIPCNSGTTSIPYQNI